MTAHKHVLEQPARCVWRYCIEPDCRVIAHSRECRQAVEFGCICGLNAELKLAEAAA